MKIIKYGLILPIVKQCKYCGTLFEYTPADIKVTAPGIKMISCPVCGFGGRHTEEKV